MTGAREPSRPLQGVEALALRLRDAGRVCVLAGAGLSAESGIPVFRGAAGLWKDHRPEELATPQAFRRDPRLVWEWYDWRRGLVAKARPNAAHAALAAFSRARPGVTLVTQNVDGLQQAAGAGRVLELHGSLWTLWCVVCGAAAEDRRVPIPIPPRCACGGLLRPGVVWFGESLPSAALGEAWEAAGACSVFLSVGTSAVVEPAASLARRAKEAGAFVVEINPEPTALTPDADLFLRGRAGELVPAVTARAAGS